MKKILVINGSPKKELSTTMAVTNAFVKGLMKENEFESEIITVSDLNVKTCLGCLSCWGRNEGDCIIKDDDVPMVKSKILAADIIIFSFPLFMFGMPGELKVLLDRLLSLLNAYDGRSVPAEGESFHGFRYDVSGKKLVVISGCAWNDDKVFSPLLGQIDCILGSGNYTALFCPQIKAVVDQGMRPRLVKYLQNYENAGEEFSKNGFLSEETKQLLKKTPFSESVYKMVLEKYWTDQRELGKKE